MCVCLQSVGSWSVVFEWIEIVDRLDRRIADERMHQWNLDDCIENWFDWHTRRKKIRWWEVEIRNIREGWYFLRVVDWTKVVDEVRKDSVGIELDFLVHRVCRMCSAMFHWLMLIKTERIEVNSENVFMRNRTLFPWNEASNGWVNDGSSSWVVVSKTLGSTWKGK